MADIHIQEEVVDNSLVAEEVVDGYVVCVPGTSYTGISQRKRVRF